MPPVGSHAPGPEHVHGRRQHRPGCALLVLQVSAPMGGPITCLRKGGKSAMPCRGQPVSFRLRRAPLASPLLVPLPRLISTYRSIWPGQKRQFDGGRTEECSISIPCLPLPAGSAPFSVSRSASAAALDEPVAIRCVERSLGDYMLENAPDFYTPPELSPGKTVAVDRFRAGRACRRLLPEEVRPPGHRIREAAGSGRDASSTAYRPYRLPKDVVRKQVLALEGMGITFEFGVTVGKDVTLASSRRASTRSFSPAGPGKKGRSA